MGEPVYHSIGEFSAAYDISRDDMNRYILIGIVRPQKIRHGGTQLYETDMMRIVQHNTREREKKARLTRDREPGCRLGRR